MGIIKNLSAVGPEYGRVNKRDGTLRMVVMATSNTLSQLLKWLETSKNLTALTIPVPVHQSVIHKKLTVSA